MHHEAANGDNSIGGFEGNVGGGDGFGAVPALPVVGSKDYLDTRGDTVGGNIAGNVDCLGNLMLRMSQDDGPRN